MSRFTTFFPSVNINSVNVCLRQWLYNHGDQCLWNTGNGWMKCLINKETGARFAIYQASYSSADASVEFLSDKISITCIGNTPTVSASRGTGQPVSYARAPLTLNANIGTVKPLPFAISKYKSIHCDKAIGQIVCIRTGSDNTVSTTVNSATVIASGIVDDFLINTDVNNTSIVIGNSYSYPGVGNTSNNGAAGGGYPGESVSANHTTDITEIWLE